MREQKWTEILERRRQKCKGTGRNRERQAGSRGENGTGSEKGWNLADDRSAISDQWVKDTVSSTVITGHPSGKPGPYLILYKEALPETSGNMFRKGLLKHTHM